jgi:hypothetical protein
MRIPEPPRHLTGEKLAREVPDDPNRSGSIYADEFLAHYCPPDLDEHQRRQFFCILDLRRLKYAADEVFVKKDWKINILNFAKEYEKSRSLIMLRYGLYEFKTVRASEAVKKEWKEKHGIPDSDDESGVRAGGNAKRKAEDDLGPSSMLTESPSGANKRARGPETSVKNKRKADADPDENHPAKLQKPAEAEKPAPSPQKLSSATKSVFESIANNAQSTSAVPAKTSGKSLFASSTASKPQGSMGRSLFDNASKPAGATGNIFGHLSDESKGSGNEGADEDSESSTDAGEDHSEAQDVSQSDEQAASGGVSTPQFLDAKAATTNGSSNVSSDGESTQGRSIFDRITRGPDGQPIKLPPKDGNLFGAPDVKERSASPVKDQAAAAPTNNTWNAGTPIKFAAPAAATFGFPATKPLASSSIDFGASDAKKPEENAAAVPKTTASQSLFGAQPQKAEGVARSSGSAANGTTPNLFSSSFTKTADAPAAAPPVFGGFKPSTGTTTSLFGAPIPAFGQQKEKEKEEPKVPSASASLFTPQPATASSDAPKPNLFQFGQQNAPAAAPAHTQFGGGLFGKPQATESKAETPTPSLFSTDATKPSGNIFGAAAAPAVTHSEGPAAPKFAFGSTDTKKTDSLFGSGAPTPAAEPEKSAETKTLFGAASTPAASTTETKSIFGTAAAAPATQANNLFGAAVSTTAQETKPIFSFGSTAPANSESKPLFVNAAGAADSKPPIFGSTASTEAKPSGLFANQPAATAASSSAPTFSFGGSQTPAVSQPAPSQTTGSIFGTGGSASFTFSAGGPDGSSIKNPFASDGTYSAPSSFNFGSNEAPSSSTPFTFGAGNGPSVSFGGASTNGASDAQQNASFGGPASGGFNFSFGGSSQPGGAPVFSQNPPAASSIFGNSLALGGGTSTGTSK